MRSENARRIGNVAFAAVVAGTIAGCAGPAPKAREGAVAVARIERARWDALPETGLYRVRFDAVLAQEIRREARRIVASEDMDYYYAEIRVLEQEAAQELRARGLCSAMARLAAPIDASDDAAGIGVIVKCSPPLF